MVARESMERYTGITSDATYRLPASPMTGSKRYIRLGFCDLSLRATSATALRGPAPGI
jgi:hypothetical protein